MGPSAGEDGDLESHSGEKNAMRAADVHARGAVISTDTERRQVFRRCRAAESFGAENLLFGGEIVGSIAIRTAQRFFQA